MMRKGVVLILLVFMSLQKLMAQEELLKKYFYSTYYSLECMRSPDGLLFDKVFVTPESKVCALRPALYTDTSPTNIAFDLLVQIEALNEPALKSKATININNQLDLLSKFKYHSDSGLYFNRYQVVGNHVPTDYFVSSVDNAHLYLALWTLSQMSEFALLAKKLVSRMNLAIFHDPSTDLVAGGLELSQNGWKVVNWSYRYFGTEARTIYALAQALDLFSTQKLTKSFVAEIFLHPQWGELLGLWDGGTFQLLLPELLLNESEYSTQFKKWFHNYVNYIESEKSRRGLTVLPTHSACQVSVEPDFYNGRLGTLGIVSSFNWDALQSSYRDLWEQVVSPHASFLLAMENSSRILPFIKDMEGISDGTFQFYHDHLGWMDGYYVQGNNKGHIVPTLLALDQTIIALTIARMNSDDGSTASARILIQDNVRVKKLNDLYLRYDQFLSQKLQMQRRQMFE